jgi:hypothetical protein
MSDDLLSVDGCVHPDGCVHHDDARRVAAGRTLVNLDAVDFAPILAALKRAAESARQLAEWEADGWIGATGHELLSQLAKRWTVLESALATAGLTENAAWIFDDERPAAEERNTAAFALQDMLRDLRTGKYSPEGKFDHATLVKRLTLSAELVQALTPSEPSPAESTLTANTDPKPGYLNLIVNKESGEVRRVGKVHPSGKPKLVRFDTDSAMWHIFLAAYRAGERGATDEEWRDGYPGEWTDARRNRKAAVKEKLFALDVELANGPCLRLVDLPQISLKNLSDDLRP